MSEAPPARESFARPAHEQHPSSRAAYVRVHPHARGILSARPLDLPARATRLRLRRMNAAPFRFCVPVQQLPEAADLPSSTTELLLGLQPRLRLPALQGGRRPLREAALGLLHPRAVPALQPVAVTIRELSVPPPCAATRGRPASPLLQVDLPVPDDRALEVIGPPFARYRRMRRFEAASGALALEGGLGLRERKGWVCGRERGEFASRRDSVARFTSGSRRAHFAGDSPRRTFISSRSTEARFSARPFGRGISLSLGLVFFLRFSFPSSFFFFFSLFFLQPARREISSARDRFFRRSSFALLNS